MNLYFSEEQIKEIYSITSFLDVFSPKISERLYCVLNNIHETPLCPVCNKEKLIYKKFGLGYSVLCRNKECRKIYYKSKEYGLKIKKNFFR